MDIDAGRAAEILERRLARIGVPRIQVQPLLLSVRPDRRARGAAPQCQPRRDRAAQPGEQAAPGKQVTPHADTSRNRAAAPPRNTGPARSA